MYFGDDYDEMEESLDDVVLGDSEFVKNLKTLRAFGSDANRILYFKFCKCLVSCSDESSMQIWSLSSTKKLAELEHHTGYIRTIVKWNFECWVSSGDDGEVLEFRITDTYPYFEFLRCILSRNEERVPRRGVLNMIKFSDEHLVLLTQANELLQLEHSSGQILKMIHFDSAFRWFSKAKLSIQNNGCVYINFSDILDEDISVVTLVDVTNEISVKDYEIRSEEDSLEGGMENDRAYSVEVVLIGNQEYLVVGGMRGIYIINTSSEDSAPCFKFESEGITYSILVLKGPHRSLYIIRGDISGVLYLDEVIMLEEFEQKNIFSVKMDIDSIFDIEIISNSQNSGYFAICGRSGKISLFEIVDCIPFQNICSLEEKDLKERIQFLCDSEEMEKYYFDEVDQYSITIYFLNNRNKCNLLGRFSKLFFF